MQKIYKPILFSLGFFLLVSCSDKIEESWEVSSPVYMSYDELRSSFQVTDGREIKQSGKMYFKDQYIFINEYRKGIHVIDNQNPEDPKNVKFIAIPGNVDMAIANNYLYADSYVDLVTIDISDINHMVEVDRDTNIFPYVIPETDGRVVDLVDESQGVIVDYEVKIHTEEVDVVELPYRQFPAWNENMMFDSNTGAARPSDPGVSFGTGGSMARFTLVNGYLYAIDQSELKLLDIARLDNPVFEKSLYVNWGIETLFPYRNHLFIGGQSGMIIYDITHTSNPEYIAEFRHATACDPVVVEGDYAYVTLRGGNLCGAIESQLDVIDISLIHSPELVATYPMSEPYGLGIDDGTLFVCDGEAGLKIYNAADPHAISANQLAHYKDIHAYDVIPLGDVLLMIGSDGLYQYDYSHVETIRQLSYIPVTGERDN